MKDDAVALLVAGLGHEARNALFGLAATIDAFQMRVGDNPEYAEYLAMLRESSNRIANVMRMLVDYAAPAPLVVAPASLDELLRMAVSSCQLEAERREVRLVLEVEPSLPFAGVDRARTTVALRDLVMHALQRSRQGGTVTVHARRGLDSVDCTFEDEGEPFDLEELARLFDPLHAGDPGTPCLGPSRARWVILDQRGSIAAQNRPHGGASIAVRLPIHAGDPDTFDRR